MNYEKKCIALIPARAGSKRVPKKNIRSLEGHPLIAYAISSALQSGVFDRVVVSTESEEIAEIARRYGAEIPFLRPVEFAGDTSSDIDWVRFTLNTLREQGSSYDCFSILRPTNPFRSAETIRRAWAHFSHHLDADSLRAVEKCKQHPAKMWRITGRFMEPILKNPDSSDTPWHSKQYQALPEVYAQNASLEIAWTRVPLELGSIAGEKIVPFVSEGYEGFDINTPEDWIIAEHLIKNNLATLPPLSL